MREERIHRGPEFLALPRHDVDRIVQKRVADLRRRFRHEDGRVGLPPHQDRQRADVIVMRVRNEDRVEPGDSRGT